MGRKAGRLEAINERVWAGVFPGWHFRRVGRREGREYASVTLKVENTGETGHCVSAEKRYTSLSLAFSLALCTLYNLFGFSLSLSLSLSIWTVDKLTEGAFKGLSICV